MRGILNVLKPPGMTSHDVVAAVRRILPKKTKVGHAGTLDPAAAGVLVVCLGAATKLVEYIVDGEKAYRAEVTLGISTNSLDADGVVTAEADASEIDEDAARNAVAGLVGDQMMTPPMHSAVRIGGQRLYELARQGADIDRAARPVTVYSAELAGFTPGARATITTDIRSSKGTYVRVLAEQIGAALGVPAHLSFLVRTAVGPHELAGSATLEEIQEARERESLDELFVPASVALEHFPHIALAESDAVAFRNGNARRVDVDVDGLARVHDADGQLLGVGEVIDDETRGRLLHPRKVLSA